LLRVTQSKLYVKSNVVKKVEPRAPYLVFPKRGGAIYTNKVGILDSPALLDPNLMGWRIDLRRFEPRFVALLLKTRTLADLADVSSVPQINNKHINPIGFPAPPLKEQTSILGRLDEDLSELGKAVKAAESEIGLLREYRTRLIADVVTGKLDVREAVSRLPEAILEAEPLDETEDMLEDEGVADDEELAAADAA